MRPAWGRPLTRVHTARTSLLKAETMKIQTHLRAGRKSADDPSKDRSGKSKSDDPVTPPVSRCVGI
jgi:hypothetical protein